MAGNGYRVSFGLCLFMIDHLVRVGLAGASASGHFIVFGREQRHGAWCERCADG